MLVTAVWVGLVIGFILMIVLTLITLPASFLMNTFSYHSPWLRFLILMYSGGVFIITFLILAFVSPLNIFASLSALIPNFLLLFTRIVWQRTHYFGLFPLYDYNEGVPEPTGFFASFFKFLLLMIGPFVMTFNKVKIEESLDQILADPATLPNPVAEYNGSYIIPGIVNEAFTTATIDAGTLGDEWDSAMYALEAIGQQLYGHKGSIPLKRRKKVEPVPSPPAAPAAPAPPVPPELNDGLIYWWGNDILGILTNKTTENEVDTYTFKNGKIIKSNFKNIGELRGKTQEESDNRSAYLTPGNMAQDAQYSGVYVTPQYE